MAERKQGNANETEQRRNRAEEHPQRPPPGTLEGPGGRHETKGEDDARNKTTRRGER